MSNETNSSREKLLEMKALLIGSRSEDVVKTLENLGIQTFLDQINLVDQPVDGDYFCEVCEVLNLALDSLPSQYILTKLESQLKGGLNSVHDQLKFVWLRSLNKCLDSDDQLNNLGNKDGSSTQNMLFRIVEIVGEKDETNYKYASKILLKCAKQPALQQILFSPEAGIKWNQVKSSGETNNLRVLELMANIACISSDCLNLVDRSGYIKQLIDLVESEDVLVSLNAIQILMILASNTHCALFLHNNGNLNWIQNKIIDLNKDNHPMAELLITSMITIFVGFGKNYPDLMISQYSPILKQLLTFCSSDSVTNSNLPVTSVTVFSHIGSTLAGKKILNSVPGFGSSCMKCISTLIYCDYKEKRVEALNCLQKLLLIEENDASGEGETLTETWFEHTNENNKMIATLIQMSRRSFPEVRLPSLGVLRVLTTHLWGQKLLAADPNFLKTLLDRSTGIDKDGKEAKFSIVRELTISPYTALCFSRSDVVLIHKYYNEGPFHIEREPVVSMESN